VIGPALSIAARQLLFDPKASLTLCSNENGFGLRGTTFTTPPIAPLPYRTDPGPPSTSILSMVQVSKGNVIVPDAT